MPTVVISIGGTERTLSLPLETITVEESIDAPATFKGTIWDADRSITVAKRDDITATDDDECVFRGMVMTRKYRRGGAGRWIDITGVDYSRTLDERQVGVPDGGFSIGSDNAGNLNSVDNDAHSWDNDKVSIAEWFSAYVAGPIVWDVDTFVTEYISGLGATPFYPRGTMRQALDQLAGFVGPTLHWFLRPFTDHVAIIWIKFPVDSDGHIPDDDDTLDEAPFGIDEDPDDVTTFDPDSIEPEFDGSNMPESVYIDGKTGFVFGGTQTVTLPIGASGDTQTIVTGSPSIQGGGSGWYPYGSEGAGGRDTSKRQARISSDASTIDERAIDGANALMFSDREVIRIPVVMQTEDAILHVGQKMSVSYPSLEVDGVFVIQHVVTAYLNAGAFRKHTFELGDAMTGRITQQRADRVKAPINAQSPANRLALTVGSATVEPDTAVQVPATLQNPSELGVPINGRTVFWDLFYYRAGALLDDPPASWADDTTTLDLNGTTMNTLSFTSDAQHNDICFPVASIEQPAAS